MFFDRIPVGALSIQPAKMEVPVWVEPHQIGSEYET